MSCGSCNFSLLPSVWNEQVSGVRNSPRTDMRTLSRGDRGPGSLAVSISTGFALAGWGWGKVLGAVHADA